MGIDVVEATTAYCHANGNTFPKSDIRFVANVFALDHAVAILGYAASKKGISVSFDEASIAVTNAVHMRGSPLSHLLPDAQREATRLIAASLADDACSVV